VIALEPLPTECNAADLSRLGAASQGTVKLRIRVETSGRISHTTVVQSSGNPALDDVVGCVVRYRLYLEPATVDGTPQLTDAYILETQVQVP